MASVQLWTASRGVAALSHHKLLCLGFSLTPCDVSITGFLFARLLINKTAVGKGLRPLGPTKRGGTR